MNVKLIVTAILSFTAGVAAGMSLMAKNTKKKIKDIEKSANEAMNEQREYFYKKYKTTEETITDEEITEEKHEEDLNISRTVSSKNKVERPKRTIREYQTVLREVKKKEELEPIDDNIRIGDKEDLDDYPDFSFDEYSIGYDGKFYYERTNEMVPPAEIATMTLPPQETILDPYYETGSLEGVCDDEGNCYVFNMNMKTVTQYHFKQWDKEAEDE